MSFKKDHLRYFVTVAEEGQITRAASRLFIAQPALSQAIALLESELGLKLLERHARGVRLTSAGEAFLDKAKAVVDSEQSVRRTAEALARASRGVIEVGFIGPPPTMTAPDLFTAFAAQQPESELSLRDLPFPNGPTHRWLEEVDVAVCHRPLIEEGIEVQPLRHEPRVAMLPSDHPLAGSATVQAAAVLGETFIGYHPEVQADWAAFHSLDEQRGGRPTAETTDQALTTLQMMSLLGARGAVTTLPVCDARLAVQVMPQVAAVVLSDVEPSEISLVWRSDDQHPGVAAMAEIARGLTGE